ncbi:MAG: hypothetical protein SFX73_05445 [Kofleriaceae bacterium]|nr:hypothetical protein [Kofleriaceae bacterium]
MNGSKKSDSGAPHSSSSPSVKFHASTKVPPVTARARIGPVTGAREVDAAPPRFCTKKFLPTPSGSAKRTTFLEPLVDSPDDKDIAEMARMACTFEDQPNAHAWLAAQQQVIVNSNHLPDWALDVIYAYYLTRNYKSPPPEEGACAGKYQPAKSDGVAVAAEKDLLAHFFCDAKLSGDNVARAVWFYDRNPEPKSTIHRAAFLYLVLSRKTFGFQSIIPFVQHDLRAINDEQFKKALDGMKISEFEYQAAVRNYFESQTAAVLGRAELEKATKPTNLVDKIYYTAAEDAFNDWTKTFNDNKKVAAAVSSFEDTWLSGESDAVPGCRETLGPLLRSFVAATKPKSKDDIQAAVSTPMGFILTAAYVQCAKGHKLKAESGGIAILISKAARWRGPRTAAALASIKAAGLAAEENSRVEVATSIPPPFSDASATWSMRDAKWDYQSGASDGDINSSFGAGVISKITPEGDNVKLEFRIETGYQPIYDCKLATPLRVVQITGDGQLIYAQVCRRTGTKEYKIEAKPVKFMKSVAEKLRVGQFIRFYTQGTEIGYPVEVYQTDKEDKLVEYTGFPLN